MRAIRGAIQVERDTPGGIDAAVRALCGAIARENRLRKGDIVSAIFTSTPDLVSDFPARAARAHGWDEVPMIGATEVAVPGAMARVCRVLVHARGRRRARHVYLGGAAALRPDLAPLRKGRG
jgi:chorismate mutase